MNASRPKHTTAASDVDCSYIVAYCTITHLSQKYRDYAVSRYNNDIIGVARMILSGGALFPQKVDNFLVVALERQSNTSN